MVGPNWQRIIFPYNLSLYQYKEVTLFSSCRIWGSHTVVMKNSPFWGTTPCSPLKVSWHIRGIFRLHLLGWRVSHARNPDARFTLFPCCTYISTLKVEAASSSETSFDFHRTTRRYITEDRILCILFLMNIYSVGLLCWDFDSIQLKLSVIYFICWGSYFQNVSNFITCLLKEGL
jgi:hypothetical protein